MNLRLAAGGVRELHWHEASEWSIMLEGNARLTAIDNAGRSYVKDLTKGTSGCSRLARHTPSRGWDRTVASFCWSLTTGSFPKETRRCFRIGCGTRRREFWQRTGA